MNVVHSYAAEAHVSDSLGTRHRKSPQFVVGAYSNATTRIGARYLPETFRDRSIIVPI